MFVYKENVVYIYILFIRKSAWKTDRLALTSVGKMGCKQAAHFGANVLQNDTREYEFRNKEH